MLNPINVVTGWQLRCDLCTDEVKDYRHADKDKAVKEAEKDGWKYVADSQRVVGPECLAKVRA